MSSEPRFVHLRLHTSYSLLEGAIRIKGLANVCKSLDMPALAITDSGNLFGALEFSENMAAEGIQPIIGCTLSISMDDDEEATRSSASLAGDRSSRPCHLALLAQNEVGFENLMELCSKAYLQSSDEVTPTVPLAAFNGKTDGLIALSGGPSGPLNKAFMTGGEKAAEESLLTLKHLFSDRLYIELQRHNLEEEVLAETALVNLAYRHNVPLVATNEPFFLEAREYEAHDALLCIADGAYVVQDNRRRLTPEHRFKSQAEMLALFADLPEATQNTIEIAKRCAFRVQTRKAMLPSFDISEGRDEAAEFAEQARDGLTQRLEQNDLFAEEKEYWDRLEYEIDIISRMEFPGYFLIVADFIKWAKNAGIPVGPGRGSGAGSVVAWALTITDLDPLRFGLLFERFLNPERVSMPDFDIDFCQERRDEVIRYVQEKYGEERVAQIITFGMLKPRAVLRDVGRVLQLPYGQVDRLCKLVPNNPSKPVTLTEAIDGEPRLQEARAEDEAVAKMLDVSLVLEGLYRHASTHAAGVVIGDRPLEKLVPLYRDPRSDMRVTQYSMKWVEPAGLVKFDFLGLKTLTVLEHAARLIRKRGIDIDISNLPLDDEKTFEMLSRGEATGVFQLESSGMRDTLRRLKPDCVEDIIALVALYRPGPMDNIPTYIERKRGEKEPDYLHPLLEPVLKETYGVIIYQEQVMQIAQILSGYSLGEADLLRRAMGKKIKAEMDQQKERFVEGAVKNDIDRGRAGFIFELVEKFAGYGFNKSHAAAYAFVAYQTAYLKANYPVEFLAASMTLDLGNTDKLNIFKQEAERTKIELLPPDINHSTAEFSVVDGKIYYALAALKNVGKQAIDSMVSDREGSGSYSSLQDFATRIDPRQVNRRAMESLVKAGAFDCLNNNRAQLFSSIDLILAEANRSAEDRISAQTSLFGGAQSNEVTLILPEADDWLPIDRLAFEFEAVGFYLSGHPLDEYKNALRRCRVIPFSELTQHAKNGSGREVLLAGVVMRRQERKSKKGNPFAFVEISDPTGRFEAVVFSDVLNSSRQLLEPGNGVVVNTEVDQQGDELKIRIQSVRAVDDVTSKAAAGLRIFADRADVFDGIKKRLPAPGRGVISVIVLAPTTGQEVELEIPGGFAVTPQIRGAMKVLPGVLEVEEI